MFETGTGTGSGSGSGSAQRGDDERAVRRARKRFARRAWARRWFAWRWLLSGALVLGVVAGSVWLVFFSSVLAVFDVTVEGVDVLDTRAIRVAAAVPMGEPLATVDLDAVAARVEDLAPVQAVDVSRSWPDKVRILVDERTAVAVVERDGALRGLDGDGVIFRDYQRAPSDLPLVKMSAKTRSDALAESAEVVAALPVDLARRVDFVEVKTVDTISLSLRRGRTIFWGSADDSADKARVIDVLLEAAPKATTYDVSVPGQPTTRR